MIVLFGSRRRHSSQGSQAPNVPGGLSRKKKKKNLFLEDPAVKKGTIFPTVESRPACSSQLSGFSISNIHTAFVGCTHRYANQTIAEGTTAAIGPIGTHHKRTLN